MGASASRSNPRNVYSVSDLGGGGYGEVGPLDTLPLIFKWRASVINRTWWKILFVVAWSCGIVAAYVYVEKLRYKFNPNLITLMGIVCGLLLAFRSNSAYDRYWEGRICWTSMTQAIRTLTRTIWINVKEESSADIVEKKSVINILTGYAFAMKHYLRDEYDINSEEMMNAIGHIRGLHAQAKSAAVKVGALAKFGTGIPIFLAEITGQPRTRPTKKFQRYHFRAYDVATPSNIPLELSYYIESYVHWLRVNQKCDPSSADTMQLVLRHLVDSLGTFERILRTPIPLCYSVHLHQSIWLYILALPFQLVHDNEWWTIPVVTIIAFFFLGILAIGWELENPFGYDENDLPLDAYCQVLRREIELITSWTPMAPEDWVFHPENRPFAPECTLNSVDLAARPLHEIRGIIAHRGEQIASAHLLGVLD